MRVVSIKQSFSVTTIWNTVINYPLQNIVLSQVLIVGPVCNVLGAFLVVLLEIIDSSFKVPAITANMTLSAILALVFGVEFSGCCKFVIPSQGLNRLHLLHESNSFIPCWCAFIRRPIWCFPWNQHSFCCLPIFFLEIVPLDLKVSNSALGIGAILIRQFKDFLVNLGNIVTGLSFLQCYKSVSYNSWRSYRRSWYSRGWRLDRVVWSWWRYRISWFSWRRYRISWFSRVLILCSLIILTGDLRKYVGFVTQIISLVKLRL